MKNSRRIRVRRTDVGLLTGASSITRDQQMLAAENLQTANAATAKKDKLKGKPLLEKLLASWVVMFDAGQWKALSGCYGRHCRQSGTL